jgi:hypothetical protein
MNRECVESVRACELRGLVRDLGTPPNADEMLIVEDVEVVDGNPIVTRVVNP